MRKKIEKVLNESNEKIQKVLIQNSMDEYSKELDNIYMEKIEKIKEINEKYD